MIYTNNQKFGNCQKKTANMNFILIRHSKSLVNPNTPIRSWGLSAEGGVLAGKLNGITEIKTLDVLYSSLQTKALETAILATKNTGIPIKTDNRLMESTSFTNKFVSPEEFEQNTKRYHADKKLSINNGETSEESLNRFIAAIEDITKAEAGKKNIGIVSHANILATFASQHTGKDAYELAKNMKQPDIAILDWNSKQFTTFFGNISIE